MKIALTADLHLTTREKHPERYHALENILAKMRNYGMNLLVIAGDLFDESSRNYAEFDSFCKKPKYKDVHFIVIPGNHDLSLNSESITAENVEVITQAEIKSFSEKGLKLLFLPYARDKTMGEYIAVKSSELNTDGWILVGHGDWSEGMHEPNPLEPGVYMPLTRIDLENFEPALVVLGHIHKPIDSGKVHYPGSPCGLDIRETGRRRFLMVDTEDGTINSESVDSDTIYFNEAFIILPVKNELDYVKRQVDARIKSWMLTEEEYSKVQVQVRVSGYTSNKRALQKTLKECFRKFEFYKNGEPDLSGVAVADDINRAEIAQRVSSKIEEMNWNENNVSPRKEQILLHALHVIYGD